jgi:hypothetical protein
MACPQLPGIGVSSDLSSIARKKEKLETRAWDGGGSWTINGALFLPICISRTIVVFQSSGNFED